MAFDQTRHQRAFGKAGVQPCIGHLKKIGLQDGDAAIAYDPDGCQGWLMDDGVEGYSGRRFDPVSGLPICNTHYPPGTVVRIQLPALKTDSNPTGTQVGDTLTLNWGSQKYVVPTKLTSAQITARYVDVTVPFGTIAEAGYGTISVNATSMSARDSRSGASSSACLSSGLNGQSIDSELIRSSQSASFRLSQSVERFSLVK